MILSAKLEMDAVQVPITECEGAISSTRLSTRFRQGDRVGLVVTASVQIRTRVHQDSVFPIPGEMAFVEASSTEEATKFMTDWLLWKLARLLSLSVSDIDPQRPTHTYEIDLPFS